jgi:hypothetical protein
MDYGALIKEAWATTRRRRFLWVLGLFAGGASGLSPTAGANLNLQVPGPPGPGTGGPDGVPADVAGAASAAGRWVADNAGLLLAVFVVLALLALAWTVLSLIAQGGLAEATVDLAEGRETTLGRAWRTGLRLVWRYVGLYLILIGLAVLVALALAALVGLLVAVGSGGGGGAGVAVLLGFLLGVPLVVFGVVAGVALGIVVTYALRAIAAEDTGPLAALGSGWRLLRRYPGESLLVWLISLALGVGAAVVVGLAVGVLVAPLVLLGVGVWGVAGTGVTVGYGVLAGLLVLAAAAAVGAVVNAFFWSYWSQAYVRLRRGLGGAPVPAPAPMPA